MSLPRDEAELLIGKYTGPDAPVVAVVFLSKSLAGARMNGRLSLETRELGPTLMLKSETDEAALIFFPLRDCRFEYSGTLSVEPVLAEVADRSFEGVFSIRSASGDRLSIYEHKMP